MNPYKTEIRTCTNHGDYTATEDCFGVSECSKCEAERRVVTKPQPQEKTCEKHGTYTTNWLISWCPTCHRERLRQQEEESRLRWKQEQIARNRESSGIPARFASCTFDSYVASTPEQRKAITATRGFAENFEKVCTAGSNLILCGSVGTGKTHLAVAIADYLLDAGKKVKYSTVLDLIRSIRSTWGQRATESEATVVNRYKSISLLILDEIGISFASDAEQVQLFDVLDGRYRENKPTILISNLNGTALQNWLGAAPIRPIHRERQHGRFFPLEILPPREADHSDPRCAEYWGEPSGFIPH